MIAPAEALGVLLGTVRPGEPVEVPLHEARGRVLAERVTADRDFPPGDRSAMDGFAVRAADAAGEGAVLQVTTEIRAGSSADGVRVGEGEAVRIFTGAPLPEGADAVVMVELTSEDRASARVTLRERPEPGQNIRRRAEDLAAGGPVLEPGAPIRAAEIAALAAVGSTRVRVVGAPDVAVLSTGDEVVPATAAPAPHQVRNSNAWGLLAQLAEIGIVARDLGIAADDAAGLDAAVARGLEADALLITGGVSAGEYDLVGDALRRAGVEILFHRVAMRPGKPILAGRLGRRLVLGLPGNPVSAFTGFAVFALPALRRMAGHRAPSAPVLRATLAGRLRRHPGRTGYHLARVDTAGGRLVATPIRSTGSGDVLSLVHANAFVIAEGSPHALESGSEVDVMLWSASALD